MIISSNIKLVAQVRMQPTLPNLASGKLNVGFPITDIPIPEGVEQIATWEGLIGDDALLPDHDFDFKTFNNGLDVLGAPVDFAVINLLAIVFSIDTEVFQQSAALGHSGWTQAPFNDGRIYRDFFTTGYFTISSPNRYASFKAFSPTTVKIIAMGVKDV